MFYVSRFRFYENMFHFPQNVKVVSKEGQTAIFEIEGLYPGYGMTVGNALRRVLLSSLEGAAITQVKIKGVSHEFSTVPGVKEDVVALLVGLKKLRFKMFTDEAQTATLKVKGEKEATGKDLKLSSEVEIVNPKVHIATLTKSSAELDMELKIEKGLGYELVEKREMEKTEVGVLPLDAIYTPIEKVSFSVENMRVGKRTDFDLLKLEIRTDGTMEPEDALREAAEILCKHFTLIVDAFKPQEAEKQSPATEKKDKESASTDDSSKVKVEDMKVSERTKNALLKASIKTAGGLAKKSEESLTGVEGLGPKGITEVKKALKKLGLELKQ